MKTFGQLFAALFIIALGTFTWTWVSLVLYDWFILPFGTPVLTWIQMYGIKLFVHILTFRSPEKTNNKDYSEVLAEQLVSAIVYPGLFLLLGWLGHFFF